MAKKVNRDDYVKDDSLNIETIVNKIFQDLYDESHYANECIKCKSSNISLIDENNVIYKCIDCKFSFSPKVNSLFHKVRFSNDKWIKLLTCMVNDNTLEETVKIVQSNAETIKRKWALVYSELDWDKYNLMVREKPTKNIYADFDIIIR